MKVEFQDQKRLENGRVEVEYLMKEGEERKNSLMDCNVDLDKLLNGLKSWLDAVELKKQQ